MTRASWKHFYFTTNDLYQFYYNKNSNFNISVDNSRNKTINLLNCSKWYKIYQGKTYNNIFLSKYTLGYKLGMFSKTRKPFFFRSKKKKR